MQSHTAAAGVGAVAGVALALLVVLPYTLGAPAAVGPYYAPGSVGPPVAAVFALLASLVLAAALRGRTDPGWAAGAAVVFGLVATIGTGSWAVAVTPDLVGGFTTVDLARYHRHAVVLAALAVLAGAAGYARPVLRS